jgi:hypothetical protein
VPNDCRRLEALDNMGGINIRFLRKSNQIGIVNEQKTRKDYGSSRQGGTEL